MGLFSKAVARSGKKNPAAGGEAAPVRKSPYRGVQIIARGSDCCDAVRALEDARFLDAETPMLPLRDCDAPQCQCVYQRFDDRRDEPRRTADVAYDIAGEIRQDDGRSSVARGRRDDD